MIASIRYVKDEVSIYWWLAVLVEEARKGVKGQAIVWRSA